ncbi:hypothetical protein ES705_35570 [subsurface metagenome]
MGETTYKTMVGLGGDTDTEGGSGTQGKDSGS